MNQPARVRGKGIYCQSIVAFPVWRLISSAQ
jgi:hypothetical protein